MSAAASGGLVGVGAGNGWLRDVAAGDTDLVFALVCEEWGLIIALLLVASIICLSVFAVRVTRSGRSSYYTIAACAAAALFAFQTSLNVLGSVAIRSSAGRSTAKNTPLTPPLRAISRLWRSGRALTAK